MFAREFNSVKPLLNELHILSAEHYGFVIPDTSAQIIALLDCFLGKLQTLLNLWLPNSNIIVRIQNKTALPPSLLEDNYQEHEFILADMAQTPVISEPTLDTENSEEALIPVSADHWLFFDDEINEYAVLTEDKPDV